MPLNRESLNRRLFKALGRYDPKPVDDNNEIIPLEDEAAAFKFNFIKDGENYGVAYVTIDEKRNLTVWYDNEIMDSPGEVTHGLDYDDTWTGFLKFIKRWAKNNQCKYHKDNKDRLGPELARRKRMKEKESLSEGYHAMGKKASYNDAVPNVKIVLQHSKVMQEGEQRFRHIEKIFVENQQGERFLLPTTKPGLARVFARHIAEGGTPYDERAGHIQSLVEEYSKMAGFVRATRNGQFNESAQQLVQSGVNHYLKLRESLSKLTGRRGYTAYFESWTPPLMEDETDTNALNELFVQETLDPRIESVMPILSRLHKQVSEMTEVKELDEWAEDIISEKMVMGADTDGSSGGTVNAYIEEDEGIQSNNPQGIPEDLEESDMEDINTPKKSDVPATFRKDTGKPDWKLTQKDLEKEKERNISGPEGLKALSKRLSQLEEEDVEESGLQAYLGNKKYGKEGMDALRKAGREGASEEEKGKIKDRFIKKEDVAEDLGPEQKRVGQLGPTEKITKSNPTRGKLVGANESVELSEMDKSQPSSDRGGESSGNPYAKGGKATPIKAKDMAKQGAKTLNKAMKKKTDENFINMVPQAVAEGQEDLDTIKRLIGK